MDRISVITNDYTDLVTARNVEVRIRYGNDRYRDVVGISRRMNDGDATKPETFASQGSLPPASAGPKKDDARYDIYQENILKYMAFLLARLIYTALNNSQF